MAPPDHERVAETVLRAPFRAAFLPLRLVGAGLDAAAAWLGPRYAERKPHAPSRGPVLSPALSFGAWNDVGVGPAVTWAGVPAADARLRLAGTWSPIDRRRAGLRGELGARRPLGFALAALYDSKPNRRYYGIGNATARGARSYFGLETWRIEGALHVGASPLRRLAVVGGYESTSPRRGAHGQPLLEDVFAPQDAPYEHQATHEFTYGLRAEAAALDDARDPSRGVQARAEAARVRGLRARDLDYGRWKLETRAYAPVLAPRRVIALRAMYAGVSPGGAAATPVPFPLLAVSDGDTRFAGYHSERFRDRQIALLRAEYRWVILGRLSALALYEWGEVAPRARAFRLADAHRSWGGGLRYAPGEAQALRLEVAGSDEGAQAALVLGRDF